MNYDWLILLKNYTSSRHNLNLVQLQNPIVDLDICPSFLFHIYFHYQIYEQLVQ